MKWVRVLSAASRAASAFGFRGFTRSNQSADTVGPVSNTANKARTRAMRLSEREVLIAERREAKRQHKATSLIDARLVRLTAELAADA